MTSTSTLELTRQMSVEERLLAAGIQLPKPWRLPLGVVTVASHVRVYRDRVFASAHFPIDANGDITGPFGRLGMELNLEQGRAAARSATLSMLASLKRELGDLDRIAAWLRVAGLVNAAPNFTEFPAVLNSASDLIEIAFGREIGTHARIVSGASSLAWGAPIVIEAELQLKN